MNDDLDPATKRRIEAEERYRAQVRAQATSSPARQKMGCGQMILVTFGIVMVSGVLYQVSAPSGTSTQPSPAVQADRLEETKFGEFGQTCSQ